MMPLASELNQVIITTSGRLVPNLNLVIQGQRRISLEGTRPMQCTVVLYMHWDDAMTKLDCDEPRVPVIYSLARSTT